MKISRIVLAFACLGMLTGCSEYSMPKVAPNPQVIHISETDSKMLLTQAATSMLTSSSSLNSQLLVYLEDTIKPTTDMKSSLTSGIKTTRDSIAKERDDLNAMYLASSLKERQKNIVSIADSMLEALDGMLEAVENNDFTELKTLQTQFNNDATQMQSYSIN